VSELEKGSGANPEALKVEQLRAGASLCEASNTEQSHFGIEKLVYACRRSGGREYVDRALPF